MFLGCRRTQRESGHLPFPGRAHDAKTRSRYVTDCLSAALLCHIQPALRSKAGRTRPSRRGNGSSICCRIRTSTSATRTCRPRWSGSSGRTSTRRWNLCRKTADYPPGARFKWNAEVLWAVDSYLRKAPPEKQQRLIDAIRAGQVGLDALYGNELTGLCRPEELLRLMQWGDAIGRRCGVKVESAMISDVPGYTWGIVPAMAQAGVKYFSIGPNYVRPHRPDHDRLGRQAVLLARPRRPAQGPLLGSVHGLCAWAIHRQYKLDQRLAGAPRATGEERLSLRHRAIALERRRRQRPARCDAARRGEELEREARLSQAGHRHHQPRCSASSRSATPTRFPVVSGDFTPYWEDGAGSSARETAINRTAAERLVQAETLSAMLDPQQYPAEQFSDAWRNVILYDEHTWGAYNSITEPDKPFVKDQWKIKQAFALDGDAQSRKLLATVLARRDRAARRPRAVDVFNTSSLAADRSGRAVARR